METQSENVPDNNSQKDFKEYQNPVIPMPELKFFFFLPFELDVISILHK